MAPNSGDGRHGHRERRRATDPEPGTRPELLRDPTDDGAADRGTTEERHGEQRRHPSPHLGRALGLEDAVGHGGERDARRTDRNEDEYLEAERGRERRDEERSAEGE